ncbi:MAG: nucleotidyltransferase family protein [Planctomycetota bacterium]
MADAAVPPALRDVTAVVLAGGLGTRLRSVVSDRPKVLAEVLGRPFLAYLLDQLAAAGVVDVVLSTGYRADQIEAAFGGGYKNLRLRYSREEEPLGTGGAIRLAQEAARSDPLMVLNGDSYCGADLPAFARWHRQHEAAGSLVLVEVPDVARFGHVEVTPEGVVTRFEEKGARQGPGWINAGVYLLSEPLVREIPVGRAVSLEREVFPRWIGNGLLGCKALDCRFLDVGTPESYAAAERFFASP